MGNITNEHLLRVEGDLESLQQRVEGGGQLAQLILLVLDRQAVVDARGGDGLGLTYDVADRLQGILCQQVAGYGEQGQANQQEQEQGMA